MFKKVLSVLMALSLCALTLVMNVNTVNAATAVSASGSNAVTEGGTTTITFKVSSDAVTSGSIEITCSSSLEIVSGKFALSGTTLAKFDMSNKKGAFAFSGAKKLSGNYFTVVVKGKTIDANAWVKAVVTLKNGSNNVAGGNSTMKLKVVCKTHKYSDWKVTDPTCTKAGNKTRTCSVCGTVDTLAIAALGHDISNFEVTKKPTCTEAGTATGKCPRCNQTATASVPATGHDWGSWNNTKAATCTEVGTDARSCKACSASQSRDTELAKHDVKDGEVIQEATLTSYGIIEGTCTVCGQTVRTESACTNKDASTGVEIKCNQGVFEAGTEVEVKKIDETSEQYQQANVVLQDVGGQFQAFDISAVLNGAKVQPNGTVEVTFELPEGFSNNSCVVFVGDDGSIEIMSTVVKDGKITANLTHFSTYAVLDLAVAPQTNSGIWMYTTIGLGVTTLLFFVLFITKKPKQN